MTKTRQKQVGEITISCQQFGYIRASKLLQKLLAVSGPLAKSLASSDNAMEIVPSIQAIAASMSAEEWVSLQCEILAQTTVQIDGKLLDLSNSNMLDLAFSGRLTLAFETMAFALEVNFSDFLADLSAKLGAPKMKAV